MNTISLSRKKFEIGYLIQRMGMRNSILLVRTISGCELKEAKELCKKSFCYNCYYLNMYTRVIIFKDINNFKIFLDSADGDLQLLGKTSCFSNLKYKILIDKEKSFDKFSKEKQIEITEAVKRCIVNYKMKQ